MAELNDDQRSQSLEIARFFSSEIQDSRESGKKTLSQVGREVLRRLFAHLGEDKIRVVVNFLNNLIKYKKEYEHPRCGREILDHFTQLLSGIEINSAEINHIEEAHTQVCRISDLRKASAFDVVFKTDKGDIRLRFRPKRNGSQRMRNYPNTSTITHEDKVCHVNTKSGKLYEIVKVLYDYVLDNLSQPDKILFSQSVQSMVHR